MNSETGKANPADPRAAKMPAIPEDDLAHFEALVDRMLRDRAEAIHAVQEPLVDAPKITISHPAEFFAVERRVEERATVPPPPWTVRHARKLIGTGVLVVGAGTAYLAYNNSWRFPAEPVKTAAPAPAASEPAPVQRPITYAQQTPTAAAEAPASATVRPATPPAQPPAAAAPRKASPAPRPIAPAPAPAPTVASPAAPRAPAVTHTLRDAAPVAVGATAAPAVVAAPAPAPAAAPSDCPEGIAALGLCASRVSKGAK